MRRKAQRKRLALHEEESESCFLREAIDGMYEIRSASMAVTFEDTPCGPKLAKVENRLATETIWFTDSVFAVVGGANRDERRLWIQDDLYFTGIARQEATQLQARYTVPGTSVTLDVTYQVNGATLQSTISLSAGDRRFHVWDLVLLAASTQSDLSGKDPLSRRSGEVTQPALAASEISSHAAFLAYLESRAAERIDAYPVFIDNHCFCGIDWPAAENSFSGPFLLCRQFCDESLEPGDAYISRSLSLGVSPKGKLPEAFLRHLDHLRGRATPRASFYFDWLTHASEGPTEAEIDSQLDYFARLRREYDIAFDIYAVDDGAVETRWGLTFDRYRLQHEDLYPSGMKRLAERAKDLGMSFGIWVGPDGFGSTQGEEKARIDTLTSMIKEWNIRLIKMDTMVSAPLGSDPYRNHRYMLKLERLTKACYEANPELIIINHRITDSPYVLTLLDSTLWMGAESYPDVFMYNADRPRMFTRYASYGRGEPTYNGAYSPLLEDHGICFNGFHHGWAEEFCVQVFGRALMLSPEVYGTLFLLPDDEYPELARLMKLAREHRALLSRTTYLKPEGDFLHSDGDTALLCLINDGWEERTRCIKIDEGLELQPGTSFRVSRLFPSFGEDVESSEVTWGDEVKVVLRPFGVCVIKVSRSGATTPASGTRAAGVTIHTLPRSSAESQTLVIPMEASDVTSEHVALAERTRFAVASDPLEWQALQSLEASRLPEVNACRRFFAHKLSHECYGVASSAWDGDPTTAWGDDPYWRRAENVWRVDIGEQRNIARVIVTLSDIGPGPVIDAERGRTLEQPIYFEVSPDGVTWHRSRAEVYYRRQPTGRVIVHRLIADFPNERPARYIRLDVRGILIGSIRVQERVDLRLTDIPSDRWHGNNLLTARPIRRVYSAPLRLHRAGAETYLAIVAELTGAEPVRLKQEIAVPWIQTAGGEFWPITAASPAYPFHGWECHTDPKGRAWTFWTPVTDCMLGKELTVSLAWFGPSDLDAKAESSPKVTLRTVVIR